MTKQLKAYLQLRLAPYFYFITFIERVEDFHCAHVYMNSISWLTWKLGEKIKLGNHETTQQNMRAMKGVWVTHAVQWIPYERQC